MENIVSFMGAFLKHIIGVLVLCWRRMLWAGLIAFAIGVALVLLVAVISTGQAYPGGLALAVALIFGAALAYGIALTVFIEEFLLGVIDLIRLLEGDAKAVAHISATVAEREIGDVTHGLRRLLGLPVAARSTPPAPPTLPTLPRYPTTARPAARPAAGPAPQSTPQSTLQVAPRPAPRHEALARDVAIAGAAALASTAMTKVVALHPQATTATPAQSAPMTEPDAGAGAAETPQGVPVRADQLPRIGWTYEHEAIRPVRSAAPPDTLAELAGAGIAGVGGIAAQRAKDNDADLSAAVVAPEPKPAPASEPLDVAVVSATAIGPYGPIEASQPINATAASHASQASQASQANSASDEAPPLEDERLAEPVALSLPDEPPAPPSDEASAAPVEPAEPAAEPAAATVAASAAEPIIESIAEPIAMSEDMPPITPAPATTPLPFEAEQVDPEMLKRAPVTSPMSLHAPQDNTTDEPLDAALDAALDAPPLDPAMLTPAPATVPLAVEAEPAPASAESAPLDHPAPADSAAEPTASGEDVHAAPAPALPALPIALATPEPDFAPEPLTASAQPWEAAPEPDVAPESVASSTEPEEVAASEQEAEQEAEQPPVPLARSVFSRVTRPVAGLESTLDALNRVRGSSGPRASAPESGLWERLSQALIDRSGTPSSPFAAPQGHSASPDAGSPTEVDETPQA